MLFDMRLPVLGLGFVFVAVATLFAFEWHDPVIGALATAAGGRNPPPPLREGGWGAG